MRIKFDNGKGWVTKDDGVTWSEKRVTVVAIDNALIYNIVYFYIILTI